MLFNCNIGELRMNSDIDVVEMIKNNNLVGKSLKGVDFSGLYLSGKDLSNSDLSGVKLIGTNLSADSTRAILNAILLDAPIDMGLINS